MIPLLSRTTEHVVSFDVTWLGFVFVLISFVHMHGAVVALQFVGEGNRGGEVHLKLYGQGQEGEKSLDVDGQGGEGSWKLDNFRGCHMCIVPIRKLKNGKSRNISASVLLILGYILCSNNQMNGINSYCNITLAVSEQGCTL